MAWFISVIFGLILKTQRNTSWILVVINVVFMWSTLLVITIILFVIILWPMPTFSVFCISCVIHNTQLLLFHLLDFDESYAVTCALRSENECLISFTLVGYEKGSTVYKLRLGKSSVISLTHPIITITITIWQLF